NNASYISQPPRGFITLDSILDPENCYQEEGHPQAFIDDNLDEFLKVYGDWEVNNVSYDNTFNYYSLIETDLEMDTVTIVNPYGIAFESLDLMFISASLSKDSRGGYTDNVIAVFDNDLGEHYNSNGFKGLNYDLVEGSFKHNKIKHNFVISGRINSEQVTIKIEGLDESSNDSLIPENKKSIRYLIDKCLDEN